MKAEPGNPHSSTGSARWLWLLGAMWLLASAWLIASSGHAIATLALPDSDDNLRLLQVRDWLAGQGWFDLHQHRLAPAGGADIHWSRLVDLPLAGLILLLTPLFGKGAAETAAVVLVPLLTLLLAMLLVALIARRLAGPKSWAGAPAMLLTATPAIGMMSPLRIDHHGWQIVLLLAMLHGSITERRGAGGVLAGASIAASLAIGVEMLPYLAFGMALMGLSWVLDEGEAPRVRAFGAMLGLGTLFALLAFVAPGARAGIGCDALSMTYAGPLMLGSALLFGASLLPLRSAGQRLAAGLCAGAAAAALLMTLNPLCVTNPYYAVDAQARRLWLDDVAEAMPLYRQSAEVMLSTLVLPLIGLAGALMMLWRSRGDTPRSRGWALFAAVSALSLLLACLQTRAAIVAQALAAPGAGALLQAGLGWLQGQRAMLVRVFGSVALFLTVSGLLPRLGIHAALARPTVQSGNDAGARCLEPASMSPLDRLPPSTILADVDLTTKLLVHTHHSGLAGPYHRNGPVIADVYASWGGTPEQARRMMARYGASYVVLCGLNADLRHALDTPGSFAARLLRGPELPWLAPVPLAGTPYRVWRVIPAQDFRRSG